MRIPRPDLSATLGVPNACNACHDKPNENADWSAEKVREWYGTKRRNQLGEDLDYSQAIWGQAIWTARQGHQEAEPLLLKILSHRGTPEIVQATAISLLSQYPGDKSVAARVSALGDENPLIRLTAVRCVPQLDALQWIEQLSPLLSDPVRSVRSAAAWRLAGLPGRLFTGQQFEAHQRSIQEYVNHQLVNSDRMAAMLNPPTPDACSDLMKTPFRLQRIAAARSSNTPVRRSARPFPPVSSITVPRSARR